MSKIEWTHRPGTKSEVLNPTTGCDKVSPGCRGCYAEVMHKRLTGMGQPKYQQPFLGHVKCWPDELLKPFKWRKPRTVFLNSMSDIFHKDVPMKFIAEIYAMMYLTFQHTYIVLTKRSNRACDALNSDEFFELFVDAINDFPITTWNTMVFTKEEIKQQWPLKNVWQGVSVESQEHGYRIDELANTPAYIRVVSYEPALGPLDISKWRSKISWLISGGESGRTARPPHPDWFRQVRDQCKEYGVAYFHKQWGEYAPEDIAIKLLKPDQALGVFNPVYVYKDGKVSKFDETDYRDIDAGRCDWMHRVKKHQSGNYLDGVQHLEFPA